MQREYRGYKSGSGGVDPENRPVRWRELQIGSFKCEAVGIEKSVRGVEFMDSECGGCCDTRERGKGGCERSWVLRWRKVREPPVSEGLE